ncbi:DMT family transporter [Ammoniphilus resinae]|uniref:Small multidrug resistance pump n=1 Tax=Ammoniphilus resinae TaxID=861532 RepID=A0ABS4GSC0_9BACL|nr:multidrug efflux SMR transporter [Ammoniphilus resinae]MBP1933129.1 small multidrug resistance pump [Ammoniphilus resinae]
MSWVYLLLAILTEVSGTTAMKISQGFSKLLPTVLIFVFYGLSLSLLTLALKNISVSIAYAIWAGLGTAIIALIGIWWFREPVTLMKIISILLIIAGVIGLNLSGGAQESGETSRQIEKAQG